MTFYAQIFKVIAGVVDADLLFLDQAAICLPKWLFYWPMEGGNSMVETRVRKNESLDNALRRFKRSISKDGVLSEARKRERYDKPSVKRKKKAEAAARNKKRK